MSSPSVEWLTTLRVNFSKEVRRPCSVSAGCCFGRGGVGQQGECLDQVRVFARGGWGGCRKWGERKKGRGWGQALQRRGQCGKGGGGFSFREWSGVSDRPAGGAVSKQERAERRAWTEAAVVCWKAPYYTVTAKRVFVEQCTSQNDTDTLHDKYRITKSPLAATIPGCICQTLIYFSVLSYLYIVCWLLFVYRMTVLFSFGAAFLCLASDHCPLTFLIIEHFSLHLCKMGTKVSTLWGLC